MLHTRPLANAKMQNLQMETPEEGRGLTAHSVREIQSPFRALNSTNPTTSWGSSFDPTGLPSGCESQSRQATNPNFTVSITRNYFQQQIQKNTTSHYLLKGTSTSKAGLDVKKSCWLGKGCQAGITPPPPRGGLPDWSWSVPAVLQKCPNPPDLGWRHNHFEAKMPNIILTILYPNSPQIFGVS